MESARRARSSADAELRRDMAQQGADSRAELHRGSSGVTRQMYTRQMYLTAIGQLYGGPAGTTPAAESLARAEAPVRNAMSSRATAAWALPAKTPAV